MAYKISIKTENLPNIFREKERDHNNNDVPSSSAEFSTIGIGQNEKLISITSPSDSRSTSPNLTDLVSRREYSATPNEYTESEAEPDDNYYNDTGIFAGKLDNFTHSDGKPKFPATITDIANETGNVNDYTTSISSMGKSNYKIKKPPPLGKRALLKKLSEGTFIKRQSERHHQQIGPFSSSPPPQTSMSKIYKATESSRKKFLKYQQPVELLDLEALRRYRKAYKLSIRPSASKSHLMRMAIDHFSSMHPDPNQIISKFLLALRSNRQCK